MRVKVRCIMWVRITALLILLWPGTALGQILRNPQYAFRPTTQRDQVVRRIKRLVQPTITCPALVPYGGRFTIRVKAVRGPDDKLLKSGLGSWRVYLLRQGKRPATRCRVVQVALKGGNLELLTELPASLARDVYTLRVMGTGVDESQANAVRVYGASQPESFRFAVISDHQLWDPSYKVSGKEINAGAYPRQDKQDDNLAITKQGFAELALQDPDFVLHLGDLVYGVDYPREYQQAWSMLQDSGLAIYAVPGNHDAYGDYVVKLRGGALNLISGALGCRRHLEGKLNWGKAWVFITCMYGDIKELLYADLHRDGRVYWERQLGPPGEFAFNYGRLRFVGLNTFDGTPERRHAFSILMDAFDLRLGVPAVDNYGGYLTKGQLRFVEQQAQLTKSQGLTLVVFGHHDPRGNPRGQRYHANEPFPTDPLGMGGFEQWNYDSSKWDSDPHDKRTDETAKRNSGLALVEILARHGGYYLSGHLHQDGRQVYEKGSRLLGIPLRQRLEFIRTTTAASSVRGDGYWGYRVIQVHGRQLFAKDYAAEHGLASVPAGNLWAGPAKGSPPEVMINSGLPRPTRAVISMDLPRRQEGYRFRLRPAQEGDHALDPSEKQPRVLSAMTLGKVMSYQVELLLPPAAFPPQERSLVRRKLRALPARGNKPPRPVVDATTPGGIVLQSPEDGFDAVVGQPLLLSAARSTDSEGDRIIAYIWDLGESRQARGSKVIARFGSPGERTIKLTVVDEAGAASSVTRRVKIQPPTPPGCRGCCAGEGNPTGPIVLGAVALLLAGNGLWRFRRRKRRDKRGCK